MLIIRNEDRPGGGEWMDIDVWGTTIRVKVRPRTSRTVDEIRMRFKGMKEGRKKDEAVLNAMYDHLVEDFEGLGEETADGSARHLEVNLENKKRLLFMPVPLNEESIYVRVVNRANELGFKVAEELQKNSSTP